MPKTLCADGASSLFLRSTGSLRQATPRVEAGNGRAGTYDDGHGNGKTDDNGPKCVHLPSSWDDYATNSTFRNLPQ